MADEIPTGFVVLVTSAARSQARLMDYGRIFPTVEDAAAAIVKETQTFGSFYRLQLIELVPAAEQPQVPAVPVGAPW